MDQEYQHSGLAKTVIREYWCLSTLWIVAMSYGIKAKTAGFYASSSKATFKKIHCTVLLESVSFFKTKRTTLWSNQLWLIVELNWIN